MGNYVITGLQPWDTKIGSNAKNIALELSKDHTVLYVNLPLKRSVLWKDDDLKAKRDRILQGEQDALMKVKDGLWSCDTVCLLESINRLPEGFLFSFLNKLNNKRFAKEIKKAISVMGFDDFTLINDNCMFEGFYLKELLKPQKYIYYFRDNLTIQPYFKKHGSYLQDELFRKSDWVAANSKYLSDIAIKAGGKALDVGQGCELHNFVPSEELDKPNELIGITTPIVGYVGTLTHMRLDIPLLEKLCEEMNTFTFVFVGPQDEAFKNSVLQKMENVLFLGLKPMDRLRNYIQYFDVCINPQLVNDLTIGNYPIKIDEYLAMGKPVVATKTVAMEMFKNHVYLAENMLKYIKCISQAISENTKERFEERRAFGLTHTWANSVNKILEGPQ